MVVEILGPLWGGSTRRRWGREPDAARNISDSRKALSLRPCGALAEGGKKVVGKNFLNYTTPPCIL